MATITLAHVGKRFEATQVISDLSLDITEGQFCVLVGPSGSGKSTLLRIIAGLETVTGGTVHIGNRDVTHRPPKDRDIAMVFQSYALYPQMTVRENMGFGLKLLKHPAGEIRQRVDEAARMLDLEALMERKPAALSGGQRQRVAMGRAMVRRPAAFLFDEPLSNLDAALRATVRSEIRAIHARSKTTTVYVTHDQVEAMTMGDRIVVLRAGRIEQVGTPVELYERPINRFVAGFIGSPAMNFCELAVQHEPGQCFALIGDMRLALKLALSAGANARHRVVLGVRPEHLHLGESAANLTTLPAEVVEIEYVGAQSLVRLATPVGMLVVSAAGRPPVRSGDKTRVGLMDHGLHFFDIESGLRLQEGVA